MLCVGWGAGGNLSSYFVWVWRYGDTQTYWTGLLFLVSEGFWSLVLGAIWNCIKGTGLQWPGHQFVGVKGLSKAFMHCDRKWSKLIYIYILFYSNLVYSCQFYSILFYSIPFYSFLFCSIIFCFLLFYSILFCSILSCPLGHGVDLPPS